ncbi:MAG: hypothetical protein ACRC0X_05855 [Brevinema sp.]
MKNISMIAGIVTIFILVAYPSINNYKYNDHSKNWLNHDYGKNLLSSTEEYSIFMTEGGDNQVFSSLYFTYAEKLRQDLFPYDQKGNIFKRIYGDLRYVSVEILEERTYIVDQGLFTGLEPFYTDIRSLKKPYLVPYALGEPSTYLTWQRANQQDLGDFYYKNYGLMYKVQDIPYAIIDYIETIKSAYIDDIIPYLEGKLNREVSQEELTNWINQLVQEGLVSQNNREIIFLRSYSKPFKKDPTENFIIRWQEINNLPYYDYLSREIVISFAYEQLTLLGNKILELQKAYEVEDSLSTREEIMTSIQKYWTTIQEYSDTIISIGHDSSATLHNLGIFYLTAAEKYSFVTEDFIPKALELWELSLASSPYSWTTYNVLLWGYTRQSFVDPQQSELYLQLFDETKNKMIQHLSHWKSMKKDIEKSRPYQQSAQLFQIREQFSRLTEGLTEEANMIGQMLEGSLELNVSMVTGYFSKMANQLSFIAGTPVADRLFSLWLQAWKRFQSNKDFFTWHLGIFSELVSYGSLIDPMLIQASLADARNYLPSEREMTEQQLSLFINVLRIAIDAGTQADFIYYKNLLLQRAKSVVPPDQYEGFKNQIDQLGSRYEFS